MPTIRLAGDEALCRVSARIDDINDAAVVHARRELHQALAHFRATHGFGRGIAAPQIGHNLRMLALNLGGPRGAFTMHNPELFNLSPRMITMW